MAPRALLIVMALIEAGVGVAFLAQPSVLAAMLLGSSLETPAALVIGRVAGAALLSLGVACWLARGDVRSRAGLGLVAAMCLYNAVAAALLFYAAAGWSMSGVGLWPAVFLHAALAAWCIASLWAMRAWASASRRVA